MRGSKKELYPNKLTRGRAVLRIRDVYPGSEFSSFRIPDPESDKKNEEVKLILQKLKLLTAYLKAQLAK